MKSMSQRYASIVAVLGLLVLLGGGAGLSTATAQDGGSLTVLDWAGYRAEDFWIDFKKPIPTST